MKFAFVFPGQGSQSVGMLDAFAGNPVVRETLEEASEVLQEDMAALIARGPADQLGLTTNTQPVMLAAGVAIWRAWRMAGGAEPSLAAGHSLGEYTALVAAGALTLSEAMPLVRFRASAMQAAVPVGVGGMAAVLGLDADAVTQVCQDAAQGEVLEPANFNEPAQTVVSGHSAAIDRACELAKSRGAKRAIVLPVSAPFHSSLMRKAAAELGAYMKDRGLHAPALRVVNNVDVAVQTDPLMIEDALVRQAWRAVRWVETVRHMRTAGITHVIECGPGKVLSGLTKRIDGDLIAASMNDPASMEQTLEMLQC